MNGKATAGAIWRIHESPWSPLYFRDRTKEKVMSDVSKLEAHFYVKGEASSLVVRALRGREAISELFSFEVDLHDANASFDFDSIIGEPVHVLVTWGTIERHVNGIVTHFEQLETSDEGAFYRATLAPTAILAHLGRSTRVFSQKTVQEIIETILGEHGIENARISLADSYAKRDVVIQYGESDWDLVSRWMEAEGIRYFFEHTSSGHTLVITDAATTHDYIAGETHLAYRKEALDAGENVIGFELAQKLVPAAVTVRDYPLDDPRNIPVEEAKVDSAGSISLFEFPARQAKKRLDSLRLGQKVGRGRASTIRFAPGKLFTLEGHSRTSYNDSWLLTGVEHQATFLEGKSAYLVEFEIVPGKTSYRPERKTPWPRIFGAQMANVVGPTGAEIHTDEHGRALVTFSWDASTTEVWLPLSQGAASQGFGTVNLPRVGDAVMVEFFDGNPDRPVITGRMYNKVNVHPYTLPGNKTKTVFRDASSPGGNGYNELTFDSAKGAEEIYLRAERNARTEVQNDATRYVKNDDSITIDGLRKVTIGESLTTTVGQDESLLVTGSQKVQIQTDQAIAVEGDRSLDVTGDLEDSIDGDRTATIEGSDSLIISGNATSTIEGNRITSVSGYDFTIVSGSKAESISGDKQTIVEGGTFESHGSLSVTVTGETSYTYSGDMTIESSTIQKIGAPKIYIAAGTNLYLRALESITLEVGDSKLTVKDGKVTVTNGGSEKVLSGDTIYMNC
jgi:type VI secretion system secreted protein VgrG